jgi:hypothetical protein
MKCVVFDLDGTLVESKQALKPDMGDRLRRLLRTHDVAVISGGAWPQFQGQLLAYLDLAKEEASRLYLFPTSATSFYLHVDGAWQAMYAEVLPPDDRDRIIAAFKQAFANTKFVQPRKTWGPQLEDRGTQVTFSALGQQAPVSAKKAWDPTFEKRLIVMERLVQLLPEFEVRTGGSTSIDVTKKGIDKKYGIEQIERQLGIPISEMIFVGDALFPGGNDFPVKATGIATVSVSGPAETLAFIDGLLTT